MRRPLLLFCFAESFGILLGYYTGLSGRAAAGAALGLCALYFGAYMLPVRGGGKDLSRSEGGSGPSAAVPAACGSVPESEGRPESFDDPSGSAAKALLKGRRSFCFMACLVFFLAGFFTVREREARISVLDSFGGMPVSCEGRVLSCRYREGASQIYVRLERAGLPGKELKPCGEKVLVKLDESDIEELFSLPGRRVRFTGTVSKPDGRRNPLGFDHRLYLKGRGALAIVSPNPFRFEKCGVANLPLNLISSLKGGFLTRAEELLDERSFGLVSGLMFGEKGFMDEDDVQSFKHNGIAHVLAVSGLHVGLLYAVIMKLLGGRRDLKTGLITLALLFVYAALADFSVSVMRAGLMISLNILAFQLRRRYDMVSAASLTALVFMSADPYQLFDSGFQLSFAAAYSLGIVLPWFEARVVEISDEKKSDFIYYAGSLAGPCLAVQLGMLPLTVFHFLCFSPLSFIINPAAIALAGLILPSGLAMFAFYAAEKAFEGLSLGLLALA
ncbi:MAG: ComEC family competence protein, partial [Firmicutes bacterium]|nr:ComEC family competence protein [Bacillota bacterium]